MPLGGREPLALAARRRDERGSGQDTPGHGPENLAVLRHMALNVMQKGATKGSLRGKFKRAGWDDAYLTKLLAIF